ncbi:S-adenosylmethionine decarboxylase family protein [Paenimyroides aestuarii]|uniref:S-adenosylmethionine decarboxylase n=1 Tax=Paenimyroides aestuarii TaxID=2968490 RepID=A0ABY5NVH3_9FLAO|nr:S-adenosylmethionine decarboxylase [Paenimyroides aestuarii]UUV22545.1 S-adenosylmethionine decarboxylase [Paenimyroides aestuarii]
MNQSEKSLYNPGLHKLLTLQVKNQTLLTSLENFQEFSTNLIKDFNLEIVGISHHSFDSSGFTMAFCLKESHICIHTWPEFEQLTLDIYLCNYLKDNTQKVEALSTAYKKFFDAKVLNETNVYR